MTTTLPLTAFKIETFADEILSQFDEKRQHLYHLTPPASDAGLPETDPPVETNEQDDDDEACHLDREPLPAQDQPPASDLHQAQDQTTPDIDPSLSIPDTPDQPEPNKAKTFNSHPSRSRQRGSIRYKNLLRRSSTYLRQRFFAASNTQPPVPSPLTAQPDDAKSSPKEKTNPPPDPMPPTNLSVTPQLDPAPPYASPAHYPPKPLVYAPVHPPNDQPHRSSLPTLAAWRASFLQSTAIHLRRRASHV
ncbi:hypothetical protein DM01DRAFT_1339673 [Hesseltinella vesiculosa]|uniref:Uncharacterized protein n=1 Tax=Hesseltinella vesiculosa TaxID=101127 RepID=A0A1X2G644_9FUNG|nr:hypothetical protein DM01DRAFT_1339673 [Hesseltinella vesiculosa]